MIAGNKDYSFVNGLICFKKIFLLSFSLMRMRSATMYSVLAQIACFCAPSSSPRLNISPYPEHLDNLEK